jgi:endonuclease/exonuclease/phosphatase (EEP) superfamily protein YafD
VSAGLWLSLTVCYALRPDAAAAVTLWPAWVWLAPGLLLTGLGWRRSAPRPAAVALCWLLFLLAFAEEPRSLLRFRAGPSADWEAARARGDALRVVSLNCAGASVEAAAEVQVYRPDVVLLQETPGQAEVEELARHLFGKDAGTVVELDTAILARGTVTPVPLTGPLRMFLAHAQVRLSSGLEVNVLSLRLVPPTVRIDLWSPSCWQEQAANRRARLEQITAVARQIERIPSDVPLIVGGDFNAPAGDRIYRALRPRLRDAFREGGSGWGNTVLNDFPFARIDQVWAGGHFHTDTVLSRKTRHSDHRLVIGDLRLRKVQGR